MNFSGTFLNSVVAKRIAWILLLAVFIPTALITGLADRTIHKIIRSNDQQNLIELSKNYGLDALSNLKFARTSLETIANLTTTPNADIEKLHHGMFKSIVIVSKNNVHQHLYGATGYEAKDLTISQLNQPSSILILPANQENAPPAILIKLPVQHQKNLNIIGEVMPNYLWGEKSDYPSDINFCAYSHVDMKPSQEKHMLFCSGDAIDQAKLKKISGQKNEKIGLWELFLRAEFKHEAFEIITYRNYSKKTTPESLLNNDSFINIAILSLLVVGLMGLIHIRKTMIPLEKLMQGTQNLAKGEFKEVSVNDDSEFAKLADSFNSMSIHIQRQFNTLKNLAQIDRSMAKKLDVDSLIQQIILRIEVLIPHSTVTIFRVHEIAENEVNCSISYSKQVVIDNARVSISPKEYAFIQSIKNGFFEACHHQSAFCYQKKLASTQSNYAWIFPVLWQGEMCAFVAIGKKTPFDEQAFYWDEIRELASRIAIAISAQAREDQLLIQAQYDALTGLPNRILLQDRLQQAMEHSDHTGKPFWLAFIDLDRFKFVNDSLGHSVGDQLLTEVAKRLSAIIEDTDTVARFGGDEFIIIMQHQSESQLRMVMLNQLIEASATPIYLEGKEIFMSASIGIAVYPTDGKDADTLLKNADVAMYRAKEMGKNNFQFFTQSMNKRVTDRLSLEMHLRRAIELNEFRLVYQPKVSLVTHEIVGMEALIRWHSEELGIISPLQFIPLAEENGLIIPIGEWAMRTACAQTKAWQNMGFKHLRISVNLSARQFKQKDLVQSITQILHDTQLDVDALELELTESLVMNGVEESMKILHRIREIGVHLSVDDFGTGYSSLAYLKDLPLNTLKIDKSFTDDIHNAHDKVPIVDSIILLAKNLGLKVVAEGVEHSHQASYLATHGCDEIQGYFFSKPENPANFEAMLLSHKKLSIDSV
jgi:diguanylate cyclase (GGDEF)-like protein